MKFSAKISSRKKRLKYIPCDISQKACKISLIINLCCFKISPAFSGPATCNSIGSLGKFQKGKLQNLTKSRLKRLNHDSKLQLQDRRLQN